MLNLTPKNNKNTLLRDRKKSKFPRKRQSSVLNVALLHFKIAFSARGRCGKTKIDAMPTDDGCGSCRQAAYCICRSIAAMTAFYADTSWTDRPTDTVTSDTDGNQQPSTQINGRPTRRYCD